MRAFLLILLIAYTLWWSPLSLYLTGPWFSWTAAYRGALYLGLLGLTWSQQHPLVTVFVLPALALAALLARRF